MNSELEVRKVPELTLTSDHRVCGGGTAAGFSRFVADAIEHPVGLMEGHLVLKTLLSSRLDPKLGGMDSTRAVAGYRKLSRLSRGMLITALLRAGGAKVGDGLEAEPGATFRWGGHRGITIGSGVRLGRGVVVDVPAGAELRIGDRVKVMHYTVIAVAESLSIGSDTQIAEHVSVRDSDHGLSAAGLIREQNVSTPVAIGADVWIARGSAVLRGAVLGDGAVLGANSMARGEVEPGFIMVGSPARPIRRRV